LQGSNSCKNEKLKLTHLQTTTTTTELEMKESGIFVLYHTKKHERNSVCLSLSSPVSRNSCKTENEGHLLVTATQSLYLHHTKTQPRNEILVARIAVWGEKCLAKSETNKTTDWRSRLHMYNNQPVGCMYITAKL
jgi:hypothetical protein